MNYFAHALPYLDRPYFAAGTAVPDWLGVADRRVRVRPRLIDPHLGELDDIEGAIARGALQHLHDDQWFHGTRAFAEVTGEVGLAFRSLLGDDDRFRPGLLGHIVSELLIDTELASRYPGTLERYYQLIDAIDPHRVQGLVNRVARQPTSRLVVFIEIFRRERFLYDYSTDAGLLTRLNQVMFRIKLSPLADTAAEVIGSARSLIARRVRELLPPDHYPLDVDRPFNFDSSDHQELLP